jgi:hypothetical protein
VAGRLDFTLCSLEVLKVTLLKLIPGEFRIWSKGWTTIGIPAPLFATASGDSLSEGATGEKGSSKYPQDPSMAVLNENKSHANPGSSIIDQTVNMLSSHTIRNQTGCLFVSSALPKTLISNTCEDDPNNKSLPLQKICCSPHNALPVIELYSRPRQAHDSSHRTCTVVCVQAPSTAWMIKPDRTPPLTHPESRPKVYESS